MYSVTALVASHNRRDSTLRALAAFFAQDVAENHSLAAVLADAGSTDGTARDVAAGFPRCSVIQVPATEFWASAMAVAERSARSSPPDFLLWLNDDVELFPDALRALLDVADRAPGAIVVGSLVDPETGATTYGGVQRASRWHPFQFTTNQASDHSVAADAFHGNVVLVPRMVYERVGVIDGSFGHGLADYDFALRARKAGARILVAAGAVGLCARNSMYGTWADPTMPLSARWRHLLGPKGRPPRQLARYLRRHGGPAWPLLWTAAYLKFGAISSRDAVRRRIPSRG